MVGCSGTFVGYTSQWKRDLGYSRVEFDNAPRSYWLIHPEHLDVIGRPHQGKTTTG